MLVVRQSTWMTSLAAFDYLNLMSIDKLLVSISSQVLFIAINAHFSFKIA